MSDSLTSRQAAANDRDYEPTDLDRMRATLYGLRAEFTRGWKDRGVLLTAKEQDLLLADVRELCAYLTDLTASGR